MEPKKISFGFSKINKKLNLSANKECFKNETKVELIKCLEGHEIKLVEEKLEEQPLIIPCKESQKTSGALASLIKRRAVLLGEEEQEQTNALEININEENLANSNNEPEDIEKRAARELIAELQANGSTDTTSNLVLPVVNPDELPLDGAKESSLDDYESIPIQDFGKAMLRGMGWSEPPKVATKGGPPIDETPMVRPKGMGLGADKALKKQPLLVAPESNEVLEVKRNAYVRILGGKHKDLYGQIEGFDDHAGRVIVKMAIGGNKETFNEFLCQPISRKEFAQYGKCINSTKYDEYKKKENEFGQIILKKEEIPDGDISTKNHIKIKRERRDSREYKERDHKMDYKDERNEFKKEKFKEEERHSKHENTGDSTKEFKRERDRYEERGDRRRDDNYREGDTNRKSDGRKDDVHDRRRDKDDGNDRGRSLNRDDDKDLTRDKYKNNGRDRNTDRDGYVSKYDDERNQEAQSSNDRRNRDRERDHEKTSYRDYPEKDFNRHKRDRHSHKNNRDDERSRDNDNYAERSSKHNDKVVEILDSSDSENDSHLSKHKSSKKDKKKKSKKSKKSKSKKNDSSDCETSSNSSSSEEERRKKHKKKTKKK